MQACENGNLDEVKQWLSQGADVNFNINSPKNALDIAVHSDNHQIIKLLLEHEVIIKEYVLQKAIERDKNYLQILVPDFTRCKEKSLLTGTLLAAINIGDISLARQAIEQGAKPASLFLYAILNIASAEILQLLIENNFNIHADTNSILTKWMGSSAISDWGEAKHARPDLLAFITEYYLDKPSSLEKFYSWNPSDKSRLFRMGLDINNLNMMKFAVLTGVNKNESLNSALNRYYLKKQGNSNSQSTIIQNDKDAQVNYEIIEYIIASKIVFNDSCFALWIKPHVFTIITSAVWGSSITLYPLSRPNITSLSTKFFVHPRLTK